MAVIQNIIKTLFTVEGVNNTNNSINSVNKNMTRLGQSSASAGRAFSAQASGLGGLVAAYAGAAATTFALQQAFDALAKSARASQTMSGLKNLATASGESSTILLNNVREITKNQLTLAEAAQQINLSLSAGFDQSQIEGLADVALRASRALGRDLTDAYTRVIRGSAKLETELLDELGIYTKIEPATRAYAAAIGKAREDLTEFERRQAFVNSVIAEGERKFKAINTTIPTSAEKIEAFGTKILDVGTKIGSLLADFVAPLADFLTNNLSGSFVAIGVIISLISKTAISQLNLAIIGLEESIKRKAAATSLALIKNIKDYGNYSTAAQQALSKVNLQTRGLTRAQQAELKALRDLARQRALNNVELRKAQAILTQRGVKLQANRVNITQDILALRQQRAQLIANGQSTAALNAQMQTLNSRLLANSIALRQNKVQLKATEAALTSLGVKLGAVAAGAVVFTGKLAVGIAALGTKLLGLASGLFSIVSIGVLLGSTIAGLIGKQDAYNSLLSEGAAFLKEFFNPEGPVASQEAFNDLAASALRDLEKVDKSLEEVDSFKIRDKIFGVTVELTKTKEDLVKEVGAALTQVANEQDVDFLDAFGQSSGSRWGGVLGAAAGGAIASSLTAYFAAAGTAIFPVLGTAAGAIIGAGIGLAIGAYVDSSFDEIEAISDTRAQEIANLIGKQDLFSGDNAEALKKTVALLEQQLGVAAKLSLEGRQYFKSQVELAAALINNLDNITQLQQAADSLGLSVSQIKDKFDVLADSVGDTIISPRIELRTLEAPITITIQNEREIISQITSIEEGIENALNPKSYNDLSYEQQAVIDGLSVGLSYLENDARTAENTISRLQATSSRYADIQREAIENLKNLLGGISNLKFPEGTDEGLQNIESYVDLLVEAPDRVKDLISANEELQGWFNTNASAIQSWASRYNRAYTSAQRNTEELAEAQNALSNLQARLATQQENLNRARSEAGIVSAISEDQAVQLRGLVSSLENVINAVQTTNNELLLANNLLLDLSDAADRGSLTLENFTQQQSAVQKTVERTAQSLSTAQERLNSLTAARAAANVAGVDTGLLAALDEQIAKQREILETTQSSLVNTRAERDAIYERINPLIQQLEIQKALTENFEDELKFRADAIGLFTEQGKIATSSLEKEIARQSYLRRVYRDNEASLQKRNDYETAIRAAISDNLALQQEATSLVGVAGQTRLAEIAALPQYAAGLANIVTLTAEEAAAATNAENARKAALANVIEFIETIQESIQDLRDQTKELNDELNILAFEDRIVKLEIQFEAADIAYDRIVGGIEGEIDRLERQIEIAEGLTELGSFATAAQIVAEVNDAFKDFEITVNIPEELQNLSAVDSAKLVTKTQLEILAKQIELENTRYERELAKLQEERDLLTAEYELGVAERAADRAAALAEVELKKKEINALGNLYTENLSGMTTINQQLLDSLASVFRQGAEAFASVLGANAGAVTGIIAPNLSNPEKIATNLGAALSGFNAEAEVAITTLNTYYDTLDNRELENFGLRLTNLADQELLEEEVHNRNIERIKDEGISTAIAGRQALKDIAEEAGKAAKDAAKKAQDELDKFSNESSKALKDLITFTINSIGSVITARQQAKLDAAIINETLAKESLALTTEYLNDAQSSFQQALQEEISLRAEVEAAIKSVNDSQKAYINTLSQGTFDDLANSAAKVVESISNQNSKILSLNSTIRERTALEGLTNNLQVTQAEQQQTLADATADRVAKEEKLAKTQETISKLTDLVNNSLSQFTQQLQNIQMVTAGGTGTFVDSVAGLFGLNRGSVNSFTSSISDFKKAADTMAKASDTLKKSSEVLGNAVKGTGAVGSGAASAAGAAAGSSAGSAAATSISAFQGAFIGASIGSFIGQLTGDVSWASTIGGALGGALGAAFTGALAQTAFGAAVSGAIGSAAFAFAVPVVGAILGALIIGGLFGKRPKPTATVTGYVDEAGFTETNRSSRDISASAVDSIANIPTVVFDSLLAGFEAAGIEFKDKVDRVYIKNYKGSFEAVQLSFASGFQGAESNVGKTAEDVADSIIRQFFQGLTIKRDETGFITFRSLVVDALVPNAADIQQAIDTFAEISNLRNKTQERFIEGIEFAQKFNETISGLGQGIPDLENIIDTTQRAAIANAQNINAYYSRLQKDTEEYFGVASDQADRAADAIRRNALAQVGLIETSDGFYESINEVANELLAGELTIVSLISKVQELSSVFENLGFNAEEVSNIIDQGLDVTLTEYVTAYAEELSKAAAILEDPAQAAIFELQDVITTSERRVAETESNLKALTKAAETTAAAAKNVATAQQAVVDAQAIGIAQVENYIYSLDTAQLEAIIDSEKFTDTTYELAAATRLAELKEKDRIDAIKEFNRISKDFEDRLSGLTSGVAVPQLNASAVSTIDILEIFNDTELSDTTRQFKNLLNSIASGDRIAENFTDAITLLNDNFADDSPLQYVAALDLLQSTTLDVVETIKEVTTAYEDVISQISSVYNESRDGLLDIITNIRDDLIGLLENVADKTGEVLGIFDDTLLDVANSGNKLFDLRDAAKSAFSEAAAAVAEFERANNLSGRSSALIRQELEGVQSEISRIMGSDALGFKEFTQLAGLTSQEGALRRELNSLTSLESEYQALVSKRTTAGEELAYAEATIMTLGEDLIDTRKKESKGIQEIKDAAVSFTTAQEDLVVITSLLEDAQFDLAQARAIESNNITKLRSALAELERDTASISVTIEDLLSGADSELRSNFIRAAEENARIQLSYIEDIASRESQVKAVGASAASAFDQLVGLAGAIDDYLNPERVILEPIQGEVQFEIPNLNLSEEFQQFSLDIVKYLDTEGLAQFYGAGGVFENFKNSLINNLVLNGFDILTVSGGPLDGFRDKVLSIAIALDNLNNVGATQNLEFENIDLGVGELIGATGEDIQGIASGFGRFIVTASSLTKALTSNIKGISSFATAVGELSVALSEAGDLGFTLDAEEELANVFTSLELFGVDLGRLNFDVTANNTAQNIENVITGTDAAIGELTFSTGPNTLVKSITSIISALNSTFGTVGVRVGGTVDEFNQEIGTIFVGDGQSITSTLGTITTDLEGNVAVFNSSIGTLFTGESNSVLTTIGEVTTTLSGTVDTFKQTFGSIFTGEDNSVLTVISDASVAVSDGITTFSTNFKDTFDTKLPTTFTSVNESVALATKSFSEDINSILGDSTKKGSVAYTITTVSGELVDEVEVFAKDLDSVFLGGSNSVSSAISATGKLLRTEVTNFSKAIAETIVGSGDNSVSTTLFGIKTTVGENVSDFGAGLVSSFSGDSNSLRSTLSDVGVIIVSELDTFNKSLLAAFGGNTDDSLTSALSSLGIDVGDDVSNLNELLISKFQEDPNSFKAIMESLGISVGDDVDNFIKVFSGSLTGDSSFASVLASLGVDVGDEIDDFSALLKAKLIEDPTSLTTVITALGGTVGEDVASFASAIQAAFAAEGTSSFAGVLSGLGITVGEGVDSFSKLLKDKLNSGEGSLTSVITALGGTVGEDVASFATAIQAAFAAEGTSSFAGVLNGLGITVGEGVDSFSKLLKDKLDSGEGSFTSVITALGGTVGENVTDFASAIQAAFAAEGTSSFAGVLSNLGITVGEGVDTFSKLISDKFGSEPASFMGVLNSLGGTVSTGIESFAELISGAFTGTGDTSLTSALTSLGINVSNGVSGLRDKLQEALSSTEEGNTDSLTARLSELGISVSNGVSGLRDKLQEALSSTEEGDTNSLTSRLKSLASDLGKATIDFGDVVEGAVKTDETSLIKLLNTVGGNLSTTVKAFGENLDTSFSSESNTTSLTYALGEIAGNVATSVGTFNTTLDSYIGDATKTGSLANYLSNLDLSDPVQTYKTELSKIVTTTTETFQGLLDVFDQDNRSEIDKFRDEVNAFADLTTEINSVDSLAAAVNALANSADPKTQDIGDLIDDFVDLKSKIDALTASTGVESLTTAVAGLAEKIKDAWNSVKLNTEVSISTLNKSFGSGSAELKALEVIAKNSSKYPTIKGPTYTVNGGDFVAYAKGGLVDYAEGGSVKGPGTSTSDSIPAKLSNGEYVVKASAVNNVGSDFLDAVNSGFSLEKVLAAYGRYGDDFVAHISKSEIEVLKRLGGAGTINPTTGMLEFYNKDAGAYGGLFANEEAAYLKKHYFDKATANNTMFTGSTWFGATSATTGDNKDYVYNQWEINALGGKGVDTGKLFSADKWRVENDRILATLQSVNDVRQARDISLIDDLTSGYGGYAKRKKKSIFGAILGAIVGGLLAFVTGGASLALIGAGALGGAALGDALTNTSLSVGEVGKGVTAGYKNSKNYEVNADKANALFSRGNRLAQLSRGTPLTDRFPAAIKTNLMGGSSVTDYTKLVDKYNKDNPYFYDFYMFGDKPNKTTTRGTLGDTITKDNASNAATALAEFNKPQWQKEGYASEADFLSQRGPASGGLIKKLGGGYNSFRDNISGPRDSVPAMLQPGEFVLRKPAVDRMGLDAAIKLNSTGEMDSTPEVNVEVNVINNGNPVAANKQVKQENGKLVVDVILEDIRNNGPIKQTIRGIR